MKKLFLLLLLAFVSIGLFGCETKEEITITHQEANALIENIDTAQIAEDVISLKSLTTFESVITTKTDEKEESAKNSGKLSFEGKAKLSSYEEFFVHASFSFELTSSTTIESKTQNVKLSGNLYLIKSDLYLDFKLVKGSTTLETKAKLLNQFTEENYNELINSLKVNNTEPIIKDTDQFKVFKVGSDHIIELNIDFNGLFEAIGSTVPAPEIGTDVTTDDNNYVRFGFRFGETIKSAYLEAKILTDETTTIFGTEINSKLKLDSKTTFSYTSKISAPPSEETLSAYEEVMSLDELNLGDIFK